MVIESVTSMLNVTGLYGRDRVAVQRIACRMLCRISVYTAEKESLLRYGTEVERIVYRWYRGLAWNADASLNVWRGIHGAFELDDDRVALSYGVRPQELAFIKAALTVADIKEMSNTELQWREPPVTSQEVQAILKELGSTIRFCVRKLSFIELIDESSTAKDRRNDLVGYALLLIHKLESTRRGLHLVNTIKRSLINRTNDECEKYNAEKRCSSGRTERDTGEVDAEGKPIVERVNTQMRTQLTVTGEGGNIAEHPEVSRAAFAVPMQDEVAAVTEFVERVQRMYPRVGKYLKYAVLDIPNPDLDQHLDEVLPPTETRKRVTPMESFDRTAKAVRAFYGVTPRDIRSAVAEAQRTYCAPIPLDDTTPIFQHVVEEEEFEEIEEFTPIRDVTPRIPIARFGYV